MLNLQHKRITLSFWLLLDGNLNDLDIIGDRFCFWNVQIFVTHYWLTNKTWCLCLCFNPLFVGRVYAYKMIIIIIIFPWKTNSQYILEYFRSNFIDWYYYLSKGNGLNMQTSIREKKYDENSFPMSLPEPFYKMSLPINPGNGALMVSSLNGVVW